MSDKSKTIKRCIHCNEQHFFNIFLHSVHWCKRVVFLVCLFHWTGEKPGRKNWCLLCENYGFQFCHGCKFRGTRDIVNPLEWHDNRRGSMHKQGPYMDHDHQQICFVFCLSKPVIFSQSFAKIFKHLCMALPEVKFLSNPRRMHSREEGEEKEEQGLPRAPSCCSTTFPAPSPSPPSHAPRAHWAAWDPLSGHRPPPPSPIVNRPISSDFQEKRLKSMTASF